MYAPSGNRLDRWYDVIGDVSCGVPWVVIDSGFRFSCGYVDFASTYRTLADQAMANPPSADVTAAYRRVDDDVTVFVDVTNRAGRAIGFSDWATVSAMVFERVRVVHTGRYVRAAAYTELLEPLPDGATGSYTVRLEDVPVASWDRVGVAVVVDYRPDPNQTRFEALQSALAVEVQPTPTPYPTLAPGSPRAFLPLLVSTPR